MPIPQVLLHIQKSFWGLEMSQLTHQTNTMIVESRLISYSLLICSEVSVFLITGIMPRSQSDTALNVYGKTCCQNWQLSIFNIKKQVFWLFIIKMNFYI